MQLRDLLIVVLGSGGMSAIISFITQIVMWKLEHRAKKEDGEDLVKGALRVILHDRIKYLAKRYIEDGFVEGEDKRDLIEMHVYYHDHLGGNGFLDHMMKDVKALPLLKRQIQREETPNENNA